MAKLYLLCGNHTPSKKCYRWRRSWIFTAATSAFDLDEWLCLGDQPRSPPGKSWSQRVLTLRKNSSLNCSRRTAAGLPHILTTCRVYPGHSKVISPSLPGCGIAMNCSAEKTYLMLAWACFVAMRVCCFLGPAIGRRPRAVYTPREVSGHGSEP